MQCKKSLKSSDTGFFNPSWMLICVCWNLNMVPHTFTVQMCFLESNALYHGNGKQKIGFIQFNDDECWQFSSWKLLTFKLDQKQNLI